MVRSESYRNAVASNPMTVPVAGATTGGSQTDMAVNPGRPLRSLLPA